MRIFLISDTHFGHAAMCKFKNFDGTDVRPWDNALDMDSAMIARWNNAVSPEDKVYHLGDVALTNKALNILKILNGKKILIRGNHDRQNLSRYRTFFKDVRGCHHIDNILFTHIPVHPCSKGRFKANVHGHLHNNLVLDHNGHVDKWYHSACVERINYTPILFEEIKARIEKQSK